MEENIGRKEVTSSKVFVKDDPLNEENISENPTRRSAIGPQIFPNN